MNAHLSSIFTRALAIEDPQEKEQYLQEACGDDETLKEHVEALLASSAQVGESFFRPFAVLGDQEGSGEGAEEEEFPRMFGRYRIEEKIGQGGMGVIYRAAQIELDRAVALKMIRNARLATRAEVKRFYSEARAAAGLSHSGIVPVIEFGKVGEQHYFSMGYIDGINMAELVKEYPLTMEQVVSLVRQITEAIQYAHDMGVIHRDLKPENILISFRKNDASASTHYRAHISDFGLAKRLESEAGLTIPGELLGTPGYMSPEQALEGGEVHEAADLYSVGALLYFLLTRHAPFEGETVWDTLDQVRSSKPVPPQARRPFVPENLATICLKCLEKNPENRYRSAGEILEDIENHQQGRPLAARPRGRAARLVMLCRRNPLTAISLLLGGLLLAALIIFSIQLQHSGEELARENEIAEAAQREVQRQEGRMELTKATQSVSANSHRQALKEFLNAAKQARVAGDLETERSARWGLSDSSVRLWKRTGSLTGFSNIEKMALSRDGGTLAVSAAIEQGEEGDQKFGLAVYDLARGICLLRETREKEIHELQFHPSGDLLAVAKGFEEVEFQFLERRESGFSSQRTSVFHDRRIRPVKHHVLGFLDDGSSLLTGGMAAEIATWDYDTVPVLGEVMRSEGDLGVVAISEAANLIVAASPHKTIFGWDATTRKRVFGPVDIGIRATQISLGKLESGLAVASEESKETRIYDISHWGSETRGDPSFEVLEHDVPLQFHFGERTGSLLYLHKTGALRSITGRHLRDQPFSILRKDLSAFALSLDESILVTAHGDSSELIIWEASPYWNNQFTLPESVHRKVYSTGALQHMVAGGKFHLEFYPSPREMLSRKEGVPKAMIRHIKGELLRVLGSESAGATYALGKHKDDLCLSRVDKKLSGITWNLEIPLETPAEIVFGPLEKRVVCFSRGKLPKGDSNLAVIEPASKRVRSFSVPMDELRSAVASTEGEDTLVFGSKDGRLRWVDLRTGEQVRGEEVSGEAVISMACNKDQGLIAVALQGGKVEIYRESDWKTLRTITHDENVSLLGFGRNGQILVTGGGDRSVKVWEIASGLSIGQELMHERKIINLDVCDATESIITSTAEGEVKVWPLPVQETRDLDAVEQELQRHSIISK